MIINFVLKITMPDHKILVNKIDCILNKEQNEQHVCMKRNSPTPVNRHIYNAIAMHLDLNVTFENHRSIKPVMLL